MRLAWFVALAPLAACGPDDATGACKDNLLAGDLVITEVFADFAAPEGGTGTDDGKEWFEIYNNSDRAVSLKGMSIVHSKPDGSDPETHIMDDVTVAPGEYFTLGNSTSDLLPAYVDYGYSADLQQLNNTNGGKLALKCGDSEVDSASYEMVRTGHSRQLTNQGPPDYTLNDDPNSWCEAKDTEFESGNFGTPGQDNDCAPVVAGACMDTSGMRPVVSPAPGDLVITEMMPSPAGTDDMEEWFEIKALATFDLNGLGLGRASDTSPEIIENTACVSVQAGSHVVFAHNTDMAMNGGLPAEKIVGTFNFALVPGSAASPGDISISAGGTVIDTVTWTRSSGSKSLQLDPDTTTAAGNDDTANFCDATNTYGAGGMGTPGGENNQCTQLPPAGSCDDNGTFRPIVKPAPGSLVITEFLANAAGTGTDSTQEWFEIKNTGTTAFDLNELGLQGGTTTIYPVLSVACKSIPAGGYALFAHDTMPANNGGLQNVDTTFTFALGSKISIYLTATAGAMLLDAVTFSTTTDGLSKQLQPDKTNVNDNDDIANFCNALNTQMYGTAPNFGTPRAANVCQ